MAEASVDFNAAEQPSPGFSLAYPANIGLVEEEVTDKQEASKGGKKRGRDPQSWTVKHVKMPGLRKNSPRLQISDIQECCTKKCLQKFSSSQLTQVRQNFESMYYEQQNMYLSGLLEQVQLLALKERS